MDIKNKIYAVGIFFTLISMTGFSTEPGRGQILVRSDKVSHRVSRLTTGACLEDVNHEVYGGIYSQMVFGESFEEPIPAIPIEGFLYEGPEHKLSGNTLPWAIKDGVLIGPIGEGPKLLAKNSKISEGRIDVEVLFDDRSSGVAGLIVAVSDSGQGADNFNGYEISLDPEKNQIIFGKHRHDWSPLDRVDCPLKVSAWISLSVKIDQDRLQIFVNDDQYIDYTDIAPLPAGLVGFRTWGRDAKYRNFQIHTSGQTRSLPFQYAVSEAGIDQVSKMWSGFRQGDVTGDFTIEAENTFNGRQSQRITMTSGNGRIGIANSGLNRRGMAFVKDKEYEGVLWARAEKPVKLLLSLENADGKTIYGQQAVQVTDSKWQRIEFALNSSGDDESGRFSIALTESGSVVAGYAFLQPGPWGRFKGLPVRLDVANALIEQGITVLRYGGCMVNASEYRWKKMVGPRDQRPVYRGWWYPYSSNGWGIIDFLDFCEAAGFECIPNFNIEESPKDMVDFVEYIHGGPETAWGQKRVSAGHPEPYRIKYIQIGNEEAVDGHYVERFKLLASAIWSRDPAIIPVVGDFAYNAQIADPFNLEGAPRIHSLAAHQDILRFAKANNKPVWFDVHIWNHDPRDPDRLDKGMGMRSFVEALKTIGQGAEFKVCIFEENATNHRMRRGLSHAHAINEVQRYAHEAPILCAANCLQPDEQNDNGWDQGLLFLNQSKVWGQPSYYVTQMASRNYQPLCVESYVNSYNDALDVTACKSEDGKTLSLRVVNLDQWDVETAIDLLGFTPVRSSAEVIVLKGDLDGRNTPENPAQIVPAESSLQMPQPGEPVKYTFPAYSFTIINFR